MNQRRFLNFSDLHFNPCFDQSIIPDLVQSPAADWPDIFERSQQKSLSSYHQDSNYFLLLSFLMDAKEQAGLSHKSGHFLQRKVNIKPYKELPMKKVKHYTREYKIEIINLAKQSSKSLNALEKELSIGKSNISRWIQEYEQDPENAFKNNPFAFSESEKIKRLEKELSIIKLEQAILKKFIAQTSKH